MNRQLEYLKGILQHDCQNCEEARLSISAVARSALGSSDLATQFYRLPPLASVLALNMALIAQAETLTEEERALVKKEMPELIAMFSSWNNVRVREHMAAAKAAEAMATASNATPVPGSGTIN